MPSTRISDIVLRGAWLSKISSTLIRAGHFKEFLDEPQATNRKERPQQRSLERIREVLTIIGGLHVARESRSALDR